MSRDGLDRVRRAPTRDDQVERYRWPIAAVVAAGVGVANYIGLLFAGVATRESLMIACGAAVLLFVAYTVVSLLHREPVLPVPLKGRPPANELEPLSQFATRAEAAEEATRRNMELAEQGEFWKAEQLPNGAWGLRHRRVGDEGDPGRSWLDRVVDFFGS